uniref:procollagen-proline 4-dioxygenase n=1 Tax=Sinocyclocheilus anshuiensis TaxID=1608454 RepID=A0A671SKM3_9TELE
GIYNEPSATISEWMNVVNSNEAEENINALREGYRRMEGSLPKLEDLQGAAQGLMRLQDVYHLHVEGLVRGHFQRITDGNAIDIYKPPVSDTLSGDDCFLVGKVGHTVLFLVYKMNLNIIYMVHFNVEKYEKLLDESPPVTNQSLDLKRPDSTYLRTRNVYEKLCQTKSSQPKHFENPRLFCDSFTNGNPGLLLQPIKRELISLHPYVVLFHSFVTRAEAKSIREYAVPGVSAFMWKHTELDIAWLKESAHGVVGKVDRRITMVTGLNVQPPYAEYLQVVNYGIGGHYEPHSDHVTSDSSPLYRLKTGNRVAMFMIYLTLDHKNSLKSLGYICSNSQKYIVWNGALFWWNLHINGQGNVDTLHAGCPVIVGDKWVANKWVHEYGQEFQRHCSLNPEE